MTRLVSAMHRDQLPGAHRTPHARSGQAPCPTKPKMHRGRRNQREGARSHFRHWEPGRRPLVPIAWLSPLHSRPVQTHQATTAAELRSGRHAEEMSIHDKYIIHQHRPLLARHAFRTTRAERSVEQILLCKRKEDSADAVGPAQPSARVHGADGPCLVDKPDL